MKKLTLRHLLAAGTVGALTTLTACSGLTPSSDGGAADALDPDAEVSITVGDYPTADKPEERAAFDAQLDAFREANPNITVKPSTEIWDAQTFQAKLAGGTLPTVMGVSLTYSHELIQNGQVPNMTLVPQRARHGRRPEPAGAQERAGRGRPDLRDPHRTVLGRHRVQPRALREGGPRPGQASDDVGRSAGRRQGHLRQGSRRHRLCAADHQQHGRLDAHHDDVQHGRPHPERGRHEGRHGDETTTEALQLLHDMRWEDDTMGDQFLYDQDEIRQAFAAGKIGMVLQAPDIYQPSRRTTTSSIPRTSARARCRRRTATTAPSPVARSSSSTSRRRRTSCSPLPSGSSSTSSRSTTTRTSRSSAPRPTPPPATRSVSPACRRSPLRWTSSTSAGSSR